VASVLGQIVRDPAPRPSSRRPAISPALDVICAEAMAKEPSARFATMADFARRLEEFQQGRFAPTHDAGDNVVSNTIAAA
jgi:hypothetical protein